MTQRVPSITEADGSTVVAAGTEAAVTQALGVVPDTSTIQARVQQDAASVQARTEAITKANTEAIAWLRAQYRDEFNAKKIELAKAAGYDWEPRLTDEQKAEVEVQKILAQFPGLRDRLGADMHRLGTDVPIPFE